MGGDERSTSSSAREAAARVAQTNLRAFYIRAMRIEAHSLLRPPHAQILEDQANGKFTVNLADDGSAELVLNLPDEELMESLAARARPVTLSTERVFHAKAIKAIRLLVGDRLSPEEEATLDALAKTFKVVDLSKPAMYSFSVSQITAEGKNVAPLNDTSLAGGWFYLDVAHAEAKDHKARAEDFSVNARYTAAVPAFARLVITILDLLRFIRKLKQRGVLDLGDDLTELKVVYDRSGLQGQKVFVAPAETATTPLGRINRSFEELSLLHVLGIDPKRQSVLTLLASDGSVIQHYDSVVLHRETLDDATSYTINVNDCLKLAMTFRNEGLTAFEPTMTGTTNNQRAKGERLLADLCLTSRMTLHIADEERVVEWTREADPEPRARHLARAEFLEDIVSLEQVSYKRFDLINGTVGPAEKLQARALREIYEGKVVAFAGRPVILAEADVHVVPDRFTVPKTEIEFANITVTQPELVMFHPDAAASLVEIEGFEGERWRMDPPDDQQWWFAFAPSCVDLADDCALPPLPEGALARPKGEDDTSNAVTDG